MGMQRIFVVSSSVPAGPVSLRVHNSGALTHEVMVLPLNANQYPGQWAIGTNNNTKLMRPAAWPKPRVRAALTPVTASLPGPPPGPP